MTINAGLSTVVSTPPYLRDENDKAAVIQGIENLRSALSPVKDLVFQFPASNQTTSAYVDAIEVSAAKRRSNHWMGQYFPISFLLTLLTPYRNGQARFG